MPADFFIDAQRGIVFSKATSVFGRAEAAHHMDRLLSHPDFRPHFDQLFDFREVTVLALNHDEVRALAKRRIFNAQSRRAMVVAGETSFGMARLFKTCCDHEGDTGLVVFKEMQEALTWLCLSIEPDPGLFTGLQGEPK